MWSFQDLEVLSEENGDDEEYGMSRNACNDVQIIIALLPSCVPGVSARMPTRSTAEK